MSRFARSLAEFTSLAAASQASTEDADALATAAAVLEAEFDAVVGALEERQQLLERLSDIIKSINRRADLQETLDAIVAGAAELLDEPIAALRLLDTDNTGELRLVSSIGLGEPDAVEGVYALATSDRAAHEEQLIVDEDESPPAQQVHPGGITAAIAAPVRAQGRVAGSLAVGSRRKPRRFSTYEREALVAFADHASAAITDARMVADALHQAFHDALTGLPNRQLFADRVERSLARARRRGSRVAVLFFDLDHFKIVNDSLGHHAGDQVLCAVAERLRDSLRQSDSIARFGGDEFAILLDDIDDPSGPERLAEQLIELLNRPIPLGGRRHVVTASIGIALSGPGSSSPAALVRNADAAMYRAKLRGRNTYEVFDDRMRDRAMERLRIENELRAAIERGELEVQYQPIVELDGGRIVAAEALVRWRHPRRGLLAPDAFIGIAEESGLIGPIGEWVLEEACRACAGWAQPDGQAIGVAVNISPRQLGPRLLDTVATAITDARLDPTLLSLEITEGILLDDADSAARGSLKALRTLGVRLVLDDFGTGFSSLGYLRRLPLDGLKIDRSFIEGLQDGGDAAAIVAAVVAMAADLGLTVVAEGVETAGQQWTLADLGCRLAQGYRFSRPLDGVKFAAALAAGIGHAWPEERPDAGAPPQRKPPAASPQAPSPHALSDLRQ